MFHSRRAIRSTPQNPSQKLAFFIRHKKLFAFYTNGQSMLDTFEPH